jgi:hypothetical protein
MDGSVVAKNEFPSFFICEIGFGCKRNHFAMVLVRGDLKLPLPASQRNKFPEWRFGR